MKFESWPEDGRAAARIEIVEVIGRRGRRRH
jgi:hypothetical protein